jgi:hypothetical protein
VWVWGWVGLCGGGVCVCGGGFLQVEKCGATFLNYEARSGILTYRVPHFTRYEFDLSDDDGGGGGPDDDDDGSSSDGGGPPAKPASRPASRPASQAAHAGGPLLASPQPMAQAPAKPPSHPRGGDTDQPLADQPFAEGPPPLSKRAGQGLGAAAWASPAPFGSPSLRGTRDLVWPTDKAGPALGGAVAAALDGTALSPVGWPAGASRGHTMASPFDPPRDRYDLAAAQPHLDPNGSFG